MQSLDVLPSFGQVDVYSCLVTHKQTVIALLETDATGIFVLVLQRE